MIKSNTKTNYIILKKNKKERERNRWRKCKGPIGLVRNLILNVHCKRSAPGIEYM